MHYYSTSKCAVKFAGTNELFVNLLSLFFVFFVFCSFVFLFCFVVLKSNNFVNQNAGEITRAFSKSR